MSIPTIQRQELAMISCFDQLALVKKDDLVRVANRGESVGNQESGLCPANFLKGALNRSFGFIINRGGCLVKNHDRWIF